MCHPLHASTLERGAAPQVAAVPAVYSAPSRVAGTVRAMQVRAEEAKRQEEKAKRRSRLSHSEVRRKLAAQAQSYMEEIVAQRLSNSAAADSAAPANATGTSTAPVSDDTAILQEKDHNTATAAPTDDSDQPSASTPTPTVGPAEAPKVAPSEPLKMGGRLTKSSPFQQWALSSQPPSRRHACRDFRIPSPRTNGAGLLS